MSIDTAATRQNLAAAEVLGTVFGAAAIRALCDEIDTLRAVVGTLGTIIVPVCARCGMVHDEEECL